MKAVPLIVFVLLAAAISRTSAGCIHDIDQCNSVAFNPICAGKPGQWPLSFGSVCAMNVHNCVYKESNKLAYTKKCTGTVDARVLTIADFNEA